MVPFGLTCGNETAPLGIDDRNPLLGWRLPPCDCEGQVAATAYRILVSPDRAGLLEGVGDWWDSGRVEAENVVFARYGGKPLTSAQGLYWTVCVWDASGRPSGFAEPAYFETGLLEESDWTGSWIGAPADIRSAPLLGRGFAVGEGVVSARLYVCGLGFFEAYINGRKVGDDLLVPAWTDFDRRNPRDLLYPFDDNTAKRTMYLTYDATPLLRGGGNRIGVILGNGWYNQRGRTVEGKLWYGDPKLMVSLDIRYADGTVQRVVTDGEWRVSPGPIVSDNIFLGETYDARLERDGWTEPGFDDGDWSLPVIAEPPAGGLVSQRTPGDRVANELKPVSIQRMDDGSYMADFGENVSGWVRLRAREAAGTSVGLQFSENTDARGYPDFESAGGAGQIQQDTYVCRGSGLEEYQPRFTWHGFRHVRVVGLTSGPSPDDLVCRVVHSGVAITGGFSCSVPLINRVQELYVRTQLANYHCGVPSDCPHRERLGYTGDGHLTAEAALLNFDTVNFYRKWLRDIADSQNRTTGFVPHTAPFYGGGGGPAWGSAIVEVAWRLYRHTGDAGVLGEHYPNMAAWLRYLGTRTDDGGIVVMEEPGSWCLGDWCLPSGVGPNQPGDLPEALVNTAYYARCAGLMADMAGLLGLAGDARGYRDLHRRIADDFNRRFWDPETRRYSVGRRGCDLFAWFAGAVTKEMEPVILENVLGYLGECGWHLDTGILGTPILFDFLDHMGRLDVACRLLMDTGYPGYGYMVANGATTLWENWDGSGSHNHPMFGGISAWFIKALAGVRMADDGAGFSHIVVKPPVVPGIEWASARIGTGPGVLEVSWVKGDGRMGITLTVPPGVRVSLYLPGGSEPIPVPCGGPRVFGCTV